MKSAFTSSPFHADMYRAKGIIKHAYGPSDQQRDIVMGLLEMIEAAQGACRRAYVRITGGALDLCLWQSDERVEEISGSPKVVWVETEPGTVPKVVSLYDSESGDQVEEEKPLGDLREVADWITA